MNMNKSVVRQKIWSDKRYYQRIAKSEDFSHPGFRLAQKFCDQAKNILDVGCGDGTKLSLLGKTSSKRVGCEVSSQAIEMGKKKFPKIRFVLQTTSNLPFGQSVFDRVTSFFVLEHTSNPKKLISETIRVCKKGGLIIFLAPNFGAPNRASPNYRGSRWWKLTSGLVRDFTFKKVKLSWQKVNPTITSMTAFQPDLDTTVEPYLGSLTTYLRSQKTDIIESQSYWNMELPHAKWWQYVFRFFGERGVYPFKYWGPHLFVVTKKVAA